MNVEITLISECDLCGNTKPTYENPIKILYSKDKDIADLRFCKDCIEFMEDDHGE